MKTGASPLPHHHFFPLTIYNQCGEAHGAEITNQIYEFESLCLSIGSPSH